MDEVRALGEVLRVAGAGAVQANRGPGLGVEELGGLAEAWGRPVTWTSLHTTPDTVRARQLLVDSAAWQHRDVALWPQMSCVPITVDFTFAEPYVLLEQLPAFAALSGVPHSARVDVMRDAKWRQRVLMEMAAEERTRLLFSFDRISVLASPSAPDLEGRTLADLASTTGLPPLDAVAEMVIADDLRTRFSIAVAEFDPDATGEFLTSPSAILGLSDAGAHASQMCGAAFGCELLGEWVRERRVLPLETAVWKLTGQPADVLGLTDRGRVAEGLAADVCVFDPRSVEQGPLRRVHDQPAGGDRLVRDARGIDHVLVNGAFVLRSGQPVRVGSGQLLSATS